jgi:hypothetical protein
MDFLSFQFFPCVYGKYVISGGDAEFSGTFLQALLYLKGKTSRSLAQRYAEVRKGMDSRFVGCTADPVFRAFVAIGMFK